MEQSTATEEKSVSKLNSQLPKLNWSQLLTAKMYSMISVNYHIEIKLLTATVQLKLTDICNSVNKQIDDCHIANKANCVLSKFNPYTNY